MWCGGKKGTWAGRRLEVRSFPFRADVSLPFCCCARPIDPLPAGGVYRAIRPAISVHCILHGLSSFYILLHIDSIGSQSIFSLN